MIRIFIALLVVAPLLASDWKVGVARVKITPEKPVYLSGYASRKKPLEGVKLDLWAKALAFEDKRGQRAVVVTTDLIGLSRPVSDRIAAEVEKRYGLRRGQLLLNSSHTHSGPAVRANLDTMFDLTPEQKKAINDYGDTLIQKLVDVTGAAIGNLQPATLALGHGKGSFAINRRQMTPTGVKIGLNPEGPVDQDVPVLRVTGADGKLLAVLFGYACHNTTLGGDLYNVHGDYAGVAQQAFEEAHEGAMALFMLLCGGDANPNPRGTYALVEQHGRSLAAEVDRVLGQSLKPVRGPLQSTFLLADLAFAPHTREQFQQELKSENWFKQRRGERMLRAYDNRSAPRTVQYPVQALRFGKDMTLMALGGEVVIDYALRIKKEYPKEDTIVAGYSNDVLSYIPSLRVLKEGGYEPVDSQIYYGHPGPYAEDVEERVMDAVHKAMQRVGRKK